MNSVQELLLSSTLHSLNHPGLEEQVVFFWLIKKNQSSSEVTNLCLALCSDNIVEKLLVKHALGHCNQNYDGQV